MSYATYHIITFGCQMNVNDSSWLALALQARGFQEAALEDADIVCINTCSVREKPEQKVYSTIKRIESMAGHTPKFCIMGCVAQQLGNSLFEFSPGIRVLCGADGFAMLPEALEEIQSFPDKKISYLDFTTTYEEREKGLQTSLGPCGYVNIMQGCDNFCTYCIVPYTRGRQKSRSSQAILEECREKIACGCRELTLLGQNVNAFGKDACGDGTPFHDLLSAIAALPGLSRLRYTSPHPKDMEAEDIEAFSSLKTLCPSLHLPMQSGSSRILKRMARGYDRSRYLEIVHSLRSACPDIALSTDIIVGFPGEEECDLAETLSLMEECQYVSSYSFCYSDRPGTRATTFLDKIAPAAQHARLDRVQALQELLTSHWLAGRVGTSTEILIEKKSKRQNSDREGTSWQGRDPFGTLVHVHVHDTEDYTGKMVPVRITEQGKHCLHAQQDGETW